MIVRYYRLPSKKRLEITLLFLIFYTIMARLSYRIAYRLLLYHTICHSLNLTLDLTVHARRTRLLPKCPTWLILLLSRWDRVGGTFRDKHPYIQEFSPAQQWEYDTRVSLPNAGRRLHASQCGMPVIVALPNPSHVAPNNAPLLSLLPLLNC